MAQFTAALAAKDQDYARLLDSLTRVGDRLTETQEGREALSAYVAGDPGSYAKTKIVLRKIIEAEKGLRQRKAAAQAKQDAIARASQLRDFAAFTLDGRDRGTETTEEVIAAYQQVVAVDPSNHWDWVELARLYQDSGQQNLALGAANSALQTALDDRDREVAHNELGNILLDSDRATARGHYKDNLIIAERLSRSDPENVDLLLDLAISYRQYGDVFQWEDQNESLRWYNKSREVRELVLHKFPNNIRYKGDVSAIYSIIGSHLLIHNLEGEREWLQKSLDILNELQKTAPIG